MVGMIVLFCVNVSEPNGVIVSWRTLDMVIEGSGSVDSLM